MPKFTSPKFRARNILNPNPKIRSTAVKQVIIKTALKSFFMRFLMYDKLFLIITNFGQISTRWNYAFSKRLLSHIVIKQNRQQGRINNEFL